MKDTTISDSIFYVGADDTTLDLFESQYIVPVRLITRDNVEDYSLSGWQ